MRAHRYRITILGRLDEILREVFDDFDIRHDHTNTGPVGDQDQAALHGALKRIRALGLELAQLSRPVNGRS